MLRQQMPKGFHKHKILLDENMPQRKRLPNLNEQFDVKHVRDDRGRARISDPEVYDLAVKEGRVIVTYNSKDFRHLAGTKADVGIVGVPDRLPVSQQDSKLCALFKRLTPRALADKFISVSDTQ